jgi:hypothetical protein
MPGKQKKRSHDGCHKPRDEGENIELEGQEILASIKDTVGEESRQQPPGYWLAAVSLPIFQFILLRWYVRFFIWFQFLWRISKLDLRLLPAHPDRAGGLGFLGAAPCANRMGAKA